MILLPHGIVENLVTTWWWVPMLLKVAFTIPSRIKIRFRILILRIKIFIAVAHNPMFTIGKYELHSSLSECNLYHCSIVLCEQYTILRFYYFRVLFYFWGAPGGGDWWWIDLYLYMLELYMTTQTLPKFRFKCGWQCPNNVILKPVIATMVLQRASITIISWKFVGIAIQHTSIRGTL